MKKVKYFLPICPKVAPTVPGELCGHCPPRCSAVHPAGRPAADCRLQGTTPAQGVHSGGQGRTLTLNSAE